MENKRLNLPPLLLFVGDSGKKGKRETDSLPKALSTFLCNACIRKKQVAFNVEIRPITNKQTPLKYLKMVGLYINGLNLGY